jgi:hypothetical protein
MASVQPHFDSSLSNLIVKLRWWIFSYVKKLKYILYFYNLFTCWSLQNTCSFSSFTDNLMYIFLASFIFNIVKYGVFRKTLYSFDVLYISRVQKHIIHEWKLTFMESLCACGLHMNTCSVWDPLTSWTHKWTTKLSAVSCNMSPVISSATASVSTCNSYLQCVGLCSTHDFEVALKEIIGGIRVW